MASWDVVAFRRFSLDIQHVKPSTWNNRRHALIALAKWARDAGLISTDPMLGTPGADEVEGLPRAGWIIPTSSRLMRRLEIEYNAANTAQRRTRAVRDTAMVSLMVFAGLRISEALSIRRADIDLGDRSGKVIVRLGKREKYREIPLSKEVRKAWGIGSRFCLLIRTV